MRIKQQELNMLYALLKRNEEKLARPLGHLLGRIEKYLYQNLSIKELEEIAKLEVFIE